MSMHRIGLLAAFTVMGFAAGIQIASADAYSPVNLSPYVDTSYSGLIPPTSEYPTGNNITGNQGSPVVFDIANVAVPGTPNFLNYWGGIPGGPFDFGVTLKVTGLSINSTTAYTLINSTFGTLNDNPVDVTFIGTSGSHTFDLVEGTDMRDYNDGVFVNTTTATSLWWDNGGVQDGSGADQHFDMQTYNLSGLGLGTITEVDFLETQIVVLDQNGDPVAGPNSGGEDAILSGLSFLNAPQTTGGGGVPEPITLSIFGAGLAGAAAIRRRAKRNA